MMRYIFFVIALLAVVLFQGCSNRDESNDTNTTQTMDPSAQTLELNIETYELPENNETTVTVTTADGQEVTSAKNIVWHISDANVTEINGTKLIAKAEGTTTIRAQVGGEYSQERNVTVYKIINGHHLPPEPNEEVNNATLLGIDSNDNGVRDDVERWIYETYKDKHPIHIDIAMQAGRASKKILEIQPDNILQAKEVHKIEVAAVVCEGYYKTFAKYFNEPLLVTEDISVGYFEKLYFNTKKRYEVYEKYAEMLSGDTYRTPAIDRNMTSYCDFNTSKYEQ